MILGCHEDMMAPVDEHRAADLVAADKAIVEAGYACGVHEAVRRANEVSLPHFEMTDKQIADAIMVSWFLSDHVIGRHKRPNKPIFTSEVDKLDLTALETAIAAKTALRAEILAERDKLRRTDTEGIDRAFAEVISEPPVNRFEESVVRFSSGDLRPVFHVTGNFHFDRFKPISHFGSAVAVSRHAHNIAWRNEEEDVRVIQAWLDIRRPLEVIDGGTMSSLWLIRACRDGGVLTAAEIDFILGVPGASLSALDGLLEGSHGLRVIEELLAVTLRARGFDGICYENAVEGSGKSWITLHPSQVVIGDIWVNRFDRERCRYVLAEEAAGPHLPR